MKKEVLLPKHHRVLIADDYEITRALLLTLFQQSNNVQVVGEAWNGSEAIEMTRELLPDAIIMDIGMLPINGIDACRVIHREFPTVRVIGLSVSEDPELRDSLLSAGAVAYVSKNQDWESIINTIIDALN